MDNMKKDDEFGRKSQFLVSHNDAKENTRKINHILTNYLEIVTQTFTCWQLAMETPEQYVKSES